jgi:hypothetical protein
MLDMIADDKRSSHVLKRIKRGEVKWRSNVNGYRGKIDSGAVISESIETLENPIIALLVETAACD